MAGQDPQHDKTPKPKEQPIEKIATRPIERLQGRDRADIQLGLHDTACANLERRRSYEWKLSFGVWTALAMFTALTLGGKLAYEHPRFVVLAVFIVLCAVVLVLQGYFEFRISIGNNVDQERALQHEGVLMTMARVVDSEALSDAREEVKRHKKRTRWCWPLGFHLGITFLLMIAAGACLCWGGQDPQETLIAKLERAQARGNAEEIQVNMPRLKERLFVLQSDSDRLRRLKERAAAVIAKHSSPLQPVSRPAPQRRP